MVWKSWYFFNVIFKIGYRIRHSNILHFHFSDVIMSAMASQITGVSMVIGEFPSQKANNAENVSIWWRHRGRKFTLYIVSGQSLSLKLLVSITVTPQEHCDVSNQCRLYCLFNSLFRIKTEKNESTMFYGVGLHQVGVDHQARAYCPGGHYWYY